MGNKAQMFRDIPHRKRTERAGAINFNAKGLTDMVKMTTDMGKISVSADVFTNLAGAAATNCFGVRGMAMRSVSDGLVHLLKKEAMSKGVHVTFCEDDSIAIELHIIVKNGVNIPVICSSIIKEVKYKVSADTGVEVKSVDVFVDSIMPE